MSKTIGFVGLGRMGANMARRLADQGHQITAVYDTHAETTQAIASELDCHAASSLADLSQKAELVFTVISDDAGMEQLFADPATSQDSLFTGGGAQLFINCATLKPETHRTLSQRAANYGAEMLEACMASSIPQARNGELYLMCAGKETTFEALKPLLQDLSKHLRYIGETGCAAELKALVNMVMNINTAALAEGLGLASALGHDLEVVCEVFAQTGANSRVLETDAEDMLARDHECYFSAEHAAKDSGIANQLAAEAKVSVPLSQATEAQYRRLIELERGQLDKSAVAELTFPGRQDTPAPQS